MKSLKTLIRTIIVGLCWGLFFFEGIRVILLTNWHFDLIDSRHWRYVWNLWQSGWVIDDNHEIAFVLIIFSFIPLWLTGWASLSLIKWEDLISQFVKKLINYTHKCKKEEDITPEKVILQPTIKRKKSYKEIRPRSLSGPITPATEESKPTSPIAANRTLPNVKPITTPTNTAPTTSILDHSLFKFDSSEDDFALSFDDLDKIESPTKTKQEKIEKTETNVQTPQAEKRKNNKDYNNKKDNTEKNNKTKDNNKNAPNKNNKQTPVSTPQQAPKNVGNSSLEVIKQKGYQVISSATIKNNFVDFIGVADGQICICLVDKETGDWLADEERFNDEEPLWFSESSHRISPVRCADIVQGYLSDKLKENGIDYKISTYVIIQYGNIINAEDMFETWEDMHINVTRIDRGTPRELKLFAKSLQDADNSIDKERFEKIKKIVRNLA